MRFLKVTTFYDVYLRQFYGSRPLLAFAPYEEQRRRLFADCFGWADFFQNALRPMGYDAHELVINAEPMQRAWAVEHSVPFPSQDWILELALVQISQLNPEILFLDDTSTFPLAWIQRVRAKCAALRLIVGWCGAPSARKDALPAYDAVLSCVPEIVTALAVGGTRAFHLHHGFESRVLELIDADRPPSLGLTFVGQIVAGSAFHEERQRMLLRLAELFDIRIYSPSGSSSFRARAKNRLKPLLAPIASALDAMSMPQRLRMMIPLPPAVSGTYDPAAELPPKLASRIQRPVFGLEMFQLLHDSRATFNCHLGASRRSASNMRLFEATGVGTCLVTDQKDNLPELFEIDEEVVTYQSLEECIEKVTWLSSNPARARAIGDKARARTLRDHTYATRAARLDQLLRGLLA